jgi:transposase InsO family protein
VALAVAATGRFPVKTVAATLGVARSNLVDQHRHPERRRRGPYRREGDDDLLAEIRAVTDARPTYGYRRVAALLNRARRSCGEPPVNRKRVLRLMQHAALTLQPYTARRPTRAHEGTVVAPASNRRWASDGFEIPCWNGEVVRVAFAIDTHDREVMAWVATVGAGISGEMVRDMMLECVESRFGAVRAPQPVPMARGQRLGLHRGRDRELRHRAEPRRLLHPGPQPRKQRRLRGPREDLQARLRPREPEARRRHRPPSAPRLVRGLQRRPPPQRLAHALTP